ncbi:MAG: M42 family peptidase [Oscillospiraceae bacterium]|nr:M42 family peptidase [Oscillospiraceae bacterium]
MERIFDFLKDLSLLNAVSGDEGEVRDYVKTALKSANCDIETDNLGNLIVFKKGKNRPKNKIMLCAHIDEVGFVVQGINSDGFISLSAVGGISDSVVYGRQIEFKAFNAGYSAHGGSSVTGIIGGKPVHFIKGDEKDKQPKLSELYADIGALSREDAEKYVCLGTTACFVSEFAEFGNCFVKGKALDDRLGCALMLDMLLSELEYDMHFVFTVQEEIGARGAGVAAYSVKPDFAVILETTTACDIAGVEGEKQVCRLGDGTVVPFMDKGTAYDRELYNLTFETAYRNNIKIQTKTQIAGGNDSSSIHKTAGGVRTICLAAPCRYLHSPCCVIKKDDFLGTRVLAEKLAYKIAEL